MGTLLKNISSLLTLSGAAQKGGRHVQREDLGVLPKAALYFENGQIRWFGSDRKIPKELAKKKGLREWNLGGASVLPGFVECHTHLIFAGDRSDEFELRNQGLSYQEISARGGGILSTVKKTRTASLSHLTSIAQRRADRFIAQGVTTLEVKSGYSLNLKDEVKMLKAIKRLKGIRTVSTFLGAHALPPEFDSHEAYLQFLSEEVLPVVYQKKLAQRVDIFIEKGFFPLKASEGYLAKAKKMGFDVVIHADQLTLSGGSRAAVRNEALSADHLIQIGPREIKELAKSEVTCVLLPAADLYTKLQYPPARQMIDAGARVALATDFNPGTSPTQDLSLVGLLARLEMKMSLPEVISAYTVGAAHALKLDSKIGSIGLGKSADILCIEGDWQSLFYSAGEVRNSLVFSCGEQTFNSLF